MDDMDGLCTSHEGPPDAIANSEKPAPTLVDSFAAPADAGKKVKVILKTK